MLKRIACLLALTLLALFHLVGALVYGGGGPYP